MLYLCRRGRKEEQKERKKRGGKATGSILPASVHSLSVFLQASRNSEDSLDAAGCKACH